jgi:phage gpG-like protein
MSEVRGDERVVAWLGAIGTDARQALLDIMNTVGIDVQTWVVTEKLSGQVLHRQSGHLSASINQKVREANTTVSAVIGSNNEFGAYGATWEYGGTFTIPAHERMMTMAFGKPMKNPRMVQVRSFQRTFDERSFLRSSLRDTAPVEVEKIRVAMAEFIRSAA